MTLLQTLEKAFLEGYATSDLNIGTIFLCAVFTAAIAVYICIVYRLVNKNAFYDRSFHLSLFALAVITAMIILTIQSNIVVSLGMVGALSIVRFRTAVKNPMDLMFLFWSISVGIICGAGFAMISIIGSLIVTIGIIVFAVIPGQKETMILVVNAASYNEESVLAAVGKHCQKMKVRARSISADNVNLAIEVKCNHPRRLMESVSHVENVKTVSLVEHDGDVTA